MNKLYLVLLGIGLSLCSTTGSAQDAARGAVGYKLCAGCHGFNGEGNQQVHAPKLGGLDGWYLERQIKNFRNGARGGAGDDAHGQMMGQMAQGLKSDAAILEIVAYIATLPAGAAAKTVDGDATAGKQHYMTCGGCHGAKGDGNSMLQAPSLAGLDDWYQVAQLKKFKSGQRGSGEGDTYGAQMAPIASMLADEQAMRDVTAYINSL